MLVEIESLRRRWIRLREEMRKRLLEIEEESIF
jgi:hypothetical protein